jgi:hypothetical protein
MGKYDYLERGSWNVACECCGTKYKAEMLRKGWLNGPAMLCKFCWQPRNAQEFVRGVPDHQAPPWSRPMPPPQYVTVYSIPTGRVVNAYQIDTITIG